MKSTELSALPAALELRNRPAASGGLPRGAVLGFFLIFWTVLWGSVCIFTGVANWVRGSSVSLRIWAYGILVLSGIKLRITRRSPFDDGGSCVFVCNHQSALDIPILFVACNPERNVRFMAKESLFNIPFLGWGMSRTGFIPIRRENARHSAELFKELTRSRSGLAYSYMIFPEGTRSPDGRLQPLKRGTIGLILRLGLPVVPVTLVDACRANPKGSYRVCAGEVHVVFHEPILLSRPDASGNAAPLEESQKQDAAQRPAELRDMLLEQIFGAIASALPDDQKPPAAAAVSHAQG